MSSINQRTAYTVKLIYEITYAAKECIPFCTVTVHKPTDHEYRSILNVHRRDFFS